ncbi:PTS sugar transporter subunit IIA [Flaviflexus equikiangi]|uniref:PTS glucose transporter subunit IIA n=1 Tax=Flaviflexus equikiangi TaxID=2758573 RepID=A0ABS2TFF6_9ACTO|nr:PTS glucose transporter subunit IIA [Flaviflexus equikiangi]MBM9433072.1 PTS glucose transporter subunit IIA [Flaviflexus equikiangi]
MNLYSPLSGTVLALESVPDPVFAGLMLGPGLAIDPGDAEAVTVVSPLAGTVTAARSHAVIIGPCLVHVGINTYKSDALSCLTERGAAVEVGDPIIAADLSRLGDLPGIVLVTFPDENAWHQHAAPGTSITVGSLLGTLG